MYSSKAKLQKTMLTCKRKEHLQEVDGGVKPTGWKKRQRERERERERVVHADENAARRDAARNL